MKNFNLVVGLLGLVIALYAILSAILYSNQLWLSSFVVGGSLFLGYLNYQLNNESILTSWEKDKRQLVVSYVVYLIATLLIEIVGRFVFHFWEYPTLSLTEQIIHLTLIQYSIGFFYLYESFVLVQKAVGSVGVAFIIASLANGFLIEFINTLAPEWRYNTPLMAIEILGINVLGILGWLIMTSVPIAFSHFAPDASGRRKSTNEGKA